MSESTLPRRARRWTQRTASAIKPCTTVEVPASVAAAHLSGDHSGRPIHFDDLDGFDGMPADWRPGRDASELDHQAVRRSLDEMIAASRPLPPTAIRDAHDRESWLPVSVGLRRVPLAKPPAADRLRAYLNQIQEFLNASAEQLTVAKSVVDQAAITGAALVLQHIATTTAIGDLGARTGTAHAAVFADLGDDLAAYELGGVDACAGMVLLRSDLAELDQVYAAALADTASDLAHLFTATEIGGVFL